MSSEHSTLEKSVEDILIYLMDERVLSVGIHVSSTGGLQESPSMGHCSSQTMTEKQRKHRDDLAMRSRSRRSFQIIYHHWIAWLIVTISHMNLSTR
jgi:hypothetical protein